jgi:hypothetical protein
MKASIAVLFTLTMGLVVIGSASADPVVYTLYAETTGTLGSKAFSEAPVTIVFKGDTRDVTMHVEQGAVVYRLERGEAKLKLTQGANTTVARIADGEIYVRYDTTNGVVGFGSPISTTYPATLSCNVPCAYGQPLQLGFNTIVSALADVAAVPQDASLYSADLTTLPTSLTKSTLLTGYFKTCVNLSARPSCLPGSTSPIHTTLGDFYLSDGPSNGGSLNKAILTVEVGEEESDECELLPADG